MDKETMETDGTAVERNGEHRGNRRLQRMQNWPELAASANWSVSKLAQTCGVSVRALERHFREEMRKSPKAWLSEQRQKRAAELVREGSNSVKEIATELGYQHGNNFSRQFKKHWGYAPVAQKLQSGSRI